MTGVCGLRSFLLSGLIAVAATLPFLAAVGFGLVDLDDGSYLGDHPVLWEGTFIETVKFAFGAAHDAIWMPLTWLSYALDYRLWGEWWGGFHLHSIVVHAVNAVQCVRRWPELPRFLLPGTVLLLAYAGFCACRFWGRLRAWRINPREMLSTFNIYAFALCELGRTEGLEQLIEDYWNVVLDRYDPHRRAGSSIFALVPEALSLRGVYLTAQVALGLADPTKCEFAVLADERLHEIRRQGRRASPIGLYLLMRQAEKAGREQEAAEIRGWILEGTKRLRSTQFSCLREGGASVGHAKITSKP